MDIGQKAPKFRVFDQDGNSVALSSFSGSWVCLYFYPKDDTPGCTKQACSLRDNFDKLKKEGIIVLGISPDNIESHKRFEMKFDLPFKLLVDTEHKIADLYEVWGKRNLYGNIFMGIKRSTFIIDPNGIIRHIFKRPNVAEHADEVIAKIKELRSNN